MTLKKLVLFALALVILLPVATNATVSRYYGLGGPGTDYIVYDAANPTIYPSLTTKWIKLFGAEFSGAGGDWDNTLVYGVWDFGEGKSAIKLILDTSPASAFDINGIGVFQPSDMLDSRNVHKLNLVYGRPMGEIDFGLGFFMEGKGYTLDPIINSEPYGPPWDSATVTTTDRDIEAGYSVIGFTLGVTALEKKLDAAIQLDFPTFSRDLGPDIFNFESPDTNYTETAPGYTPVENDGSMQFGMRARYWYKYSETSTLVPHFRFLSNSLGWNENIQVPIFEQDGDFAGWKDSTTTWSDSHTDLIVGLGHNWRPVDNTLMIFELALNMHSATYDMYDPTPVDPNNLKEVTDSYTHVIWRAGAETKILDWLWGRLGARRAWVNQKYESFEGNPSIGYTETSTYVGGTAHWKRLHMDFLVEPDFFKYGPAFIGGDNPEGSGLTSRLSLRYQLDEGSWTK